MTEIDFPIESQTDIIFAVAEILNEAEDNGVDPMEAKEAALGYVTGRQVEQNASQSHGRCESTGSSSIHQT